MADKGKKRKKFKVDPEYDETDARLKRLERRLKLEYRRASDEVKKKADAFMQEFKAKDEQMRQKMQDGLITQTEYAQWRMNQLLVGARWSEMREVLAYDYVHANQIANEMIYGAVVRSYASNHNYGVYEVEKAFHIDTGLNLYDMNAMQYIVLHDPQLLPMPSPKRLKQIKEAGDVLWNKQQLQSVMTQAILQGDSVGQIAKRLADTVGEKNYYAAVRNARTMVTAASNYGRIEAYKAAAERGAKGYQEWQAVHDERTRTAHREADGQRVQPGEKFIVDGYEMECPGDKSAPGYLVYNCRCGVKFVPEGLTPTAEKTRVIAGYSSYEEWKHAKPQNLYEIERVGEDGKLYKPYRKGEKPW